MGTLANTSFQTFIGHEAQRVCHFSLQDFDEEILLFTLSNRSHLFINMKTMKKPWFDLIWCLSSPCQLQVACECLTTLSGLCLIEGGRFQVLSPTQEISLQLLSEATGCTWLSWVTMPLSHLLFRAMGLHRLQLFLFLL